MRRNQSRGCSRWVLQLCRKFRLDPHARFIFFCSSSPAFIHPFTDQSTMSARPTKKRRLEREEVELPGILRQLPSSNKGYDSCSLIFQFSPSDRYICHLCRYVGNKNEIYCHSADQAHIKSVEAARRAVEILKLGTQIIEAGHDVQKNLEHDVWKKRFRFPVVLSSKNTNFPIFDESVFEKEYKSCFVMERLALVELAAWKAVTILENYPKDFHGVLYYSHKGWKKDKAKTRKSSSVGIIISRVKEFTDPDEF